MPSKARRCASSSRASRPAFIASSHAVANSGMSLRQMLAVYREMPTAAAALPTLQVSARAAQKAVSFSGVNFMHGTINRAAQSTRTLSAAIADDVAHRAHAAFEFRCDALVPQPLLVQLANHLHLAIGQRGSGMVLATPQSRFQLSLLAHPDHFHTSQFANYYVQIFTSSRIAKFCEFTTPKPWVHHTKAPHRCTTTTPYYVGGLGSWCKQHGMRPAPFAPWCKRWCRWCNQLAKN